MCLTTTKESFKKASNIRKTDQEIIAYKIIRPDNESIFNLFDWPNKGIVKSDRNGTKRTPKEVTWNEVYKGLHLFVNKPETCLYPKSCNYPCIILHQSSYQCPSETNTKNKVLKVRFSSKDVVSYGNWIGKESVVVTKCEVLEVI